MTAIELDISSDQAAYAAGCQDGRAALEAELAARCADVLVPVPTPWSLVRPGDVMRAPTGTLWLVWSIRDRPDGMRAPLLLAMGRQYPAQGQDAPVHPDERVPILVPMPENAALSALRDGLGEAHVRRLRGVQ